MTVFKQKNGRAAGTWVYKFKFQKKQYQKKRFKTKKEAEAAEAERKKAVKAEANANQELETTSIMYSALSKQYLINKEGRLEKNTWNQKKFVLSQLARFTGDDFIAEEISSKIIYDYLTLAKDRRGAKAANRDLRDLKSVYNWGLTNGILNNNPFRRIEKYKEDPYVKYIPPTEDLNRVIMAATGDEKDFLLTLYHTAGRRGEVLERLKWEDINFEQKWVRLWTKKRRGGELTPRIIGMNDTLFNVLHRKWKKRNKDIPWVFVSARTESGQYSKEAKKTMMRRLCKKAGVKYFTFHAIRHLVASILNDSQKANVSQIQNFLGHARITTTSHYLHELQPENGVANILDNIEERAKDESQKCG